MDSRPVKVLGIGGSTREGSMSLVLLKCALNLAASAGAHTSLADIRTLNLPMYNSDVPLDAHSAYEGEDPAAEQAQPSSVHSFLAAVRAADALLICSPTYHGTISGAVKNALDYLEFMARDTPRYLGGRVVGLLGLGGAGAMNVLNAAYHTVRTVNGLAVTTTAIVPKNALDADSLTITDSALRDRVTAMTNEVIALAALTRSRRAT